MSRFRLAGILIAFAVVVLIAATTDRAAVFDALTRIDLWDVALGLVIVQLQILAAAARWRFTAHRLGQTMSLRHAVREYYLASALNQVLPGGVAGDVLRAYRNRSDGRVGLLLSARVVAMERLSGQLAFFLILMTGLMVFLFQVREDLRDLMTELLIAMGIAVVAIAVVGFLAVRAWKGVRKDFALAFVHDGAWRVQAMLSLGAVCLYIGLFWFAGWATGATLPWIGAVTVVPICLLAMMIPTGFGGWGTREAAAAALWPLIGLSSAEGVAASVVYGGLTLAGSLPGLAILLSTRGAAPHSVHDTSRA